MQLRVVLRQLNAGLRTSRSEREGYVFFRGGNRARMELDKQFVLEELQKAGKDEHVQKAVQELPDKIDHNKDAALLQKFGLDPGKLAEKAAERGIASL